MIRLDHVMVRTTDIQKSINFYETVFDMKLDAYDPHLEDGYNLAFMKCEVSGVKIELTENIGISDYETGDRWGHISFYVDNALEIMDKAKTLFNCKTRHRVHKSKDKEYIIGVVISTENIEIAVVQKVK